MSTLTWIDMSASTVDLITRAPRPNAHIYSFPKSRGARGVSVLAVCVFTGAKDSSPNSRLFSDTILSFLEDRSPESPCATFPLRACKPAMSPLLNKHLTRSRDDLFYPKVNLHDPGLPPRMCTDFGGVWVTIVDRSIDRSIYHRQIGKTRNPRSIFVGRRWRTGKRIRARDVESTDDRHQPTLSPCLPRSLRLSTLCPRMRPRCLARAK